METDNLKEHKPTLSKSSTIIFPPNTWTIKDVMALNPHVCRITIYNKVKRMKQHNTVKTIGTRKIGRGKPPELYCLHDPSTDVNQNSQAVETFSNNLPF